MNKEDLLKAIMELPKVAANNPISAMNGINVEDLMNAIDRLNKVPDYNDLLKENKQLKERIEYLERNNNRREDTILEQRQRISDLEDNWNSLKKQVINSFNKSQDIQFLDVLQDMQELEQGSDSNE